MHYLFSGRQERNFSKATRQQSSLFCGHAVKLHFSREVHTSGKTVALHCMRSTGRNTGNVTRVFWFSSRAPSICLDESRAR